jgi:membrane-associated phospholipid phosphatase
VQAKQTHSRFVSVAIYRHAVQRNRITMEPPLRKRILLILAVFAIQSNYVIATRFVQGGIEPKLPIDHFPLWVVWVVPYVLCYPLWAIGVIWLVRKMDETLFRSAIAGFFLTCSLGIATFYLFPTYVIDPKVTGADIFSKTLLLIQRLDGDYAALPSAHIYITVILALFYRDWYPRYKWLWLFIVVIVALSTLFTKQHYIADVISGVFTGWLGYRFGLRWNKIDFGRLNLLRHNV